MPLLIYMQKSRVRLSKSLRKKENKKRTKQFPLLASLLLSDTNLYNLNNFYPPCLVEHFVGKAIAGDHTKEPMKYQEHYKIAKYTQKGSQKVQLIIAIQEGKEISRSPNVELHETQNEVVSSIPRSEKIPTLNGDMEIPRTLWVYIALSFSRNESPADLGRMAEGQDFRT